MSELTRAMAAVLRRSAALMPADRREWAEAAWAEVAEVPAGWQRLRWLAGGLRLTMREAARGRRLWYPPGLRGRGRGYGVECMVRAAW